MVKTPKEWAEQAFPNAPGAQRICEQVVEVAVMDAVLEDFLYVWEELVCEDDDKLTGDAIQLKQRLKCFVNELKYEED